MGNLASCSGAPPTVEPSPLIVARVLLIDGSMLKFRSPVKVINLLLDYPDHVICPLDSLKPGLHSLSRLLPDEKLQLGRLYLLLPSKTHMKAQQSGHEKLLQGREQKPGSQAARGGKERSARQQLVSTQKLKVDFAAGEQSDVGFADSGDKLNRNVVRCDIVKRIPERTSATRDICQWSPKKGRQGFLRKPDMGSIKWSDLNRKSDGGRRQHHRARRSAAGSSYWELSERRRGKESSHEKKGDYIAGLSLQYSRRSRGDNVRRPLCDTPELQRAYRSWRLRRSTSWTPRLQPILERQ